MRIISGTCKSMPLKTPKGLHTRPTTDRIKETLFNMIQYDIAQSRFLDLFSGSGGIGLEALSRGANEVVFVENDKDAILCIEQNIQFTGLTHNTLLKTDVLAAIRQLNGQPPFDIIFMDPPYGLGMERQVLTALIQSSLVSMDTLLIVEADLTTDFSYLDALGYTMTKYKKYKSNAHVFMMLKESDTDQNGGK